MSYAGIFTDKNSVDHPVTAVLYGTCATAADTTAKVVTCADFDTLMTGVTIRVKFTNGNSAADPTININNTGAKSVFRFGSTAPVGDNSWEAGAVVELTYDGTSFFMTGSDDIGALYNAIDAKQAITDNSLQTTSKTIVGGINELKSGLTNIKAGVVEVTAEAAAYGYATVSVPYGNTKYSVVLTVDYATNFTDAVLAVTARTGSNVRVGFYNKTNASLTLLINYVIIPNN